MEEDPDPANIFSGGLLKRLSSVFVFLSLEGSLVNKLSSSRAATVVFLAGAGLDEVDGGALEGGKNRSSPPNRSAGDVVSFSSDLIGTSLKLYNILYYS